MNDNRVEYFAEMDALSQPVIASKVVRILPQTTELQRLAALEAANYNLFNLPTQMISGGDYLTDSGTGGLLEQQRAAMELADEAYAGSTSFQNFEQLFSDVTRFKYIFPVHQGRSAEKLLFGHILKKDEIVVSNSLFDTTRAHIEAQAVQGIDLVIPEAFDLTNLHPFKGNIDLVKLSAQIATSHGQGKKIAACVMTLTNNAGGGQPVSLENVRSAKAILSEHAIPLIIDACRIAENAYFIQQNEASAKMKSIVEIVMEIFSYADGFIMSAKKDGLANMGGVLGFNHDEWAEHIKPALILNEGFLHYGGMSGRDMEAVTVGFKAAMTDSYLQARINDTKFLANELKKRGIPIFEPCGGHAVYIDAGKMLPNIPTDEFPGQVLVILAYLIGGIRSCELGSVMFGQYDDQNNPTKLTQPHRYELVRFAIPRLTYSRSTLQRIAITLDIVAKMNAAHPDSIPGVQYALKPRILPHFSAQFRPTKPFRLTADFQELLSLSH